MENNIRKSKGITLVALVVTIIILLILAGISISTLTNSGLFENAREAETKSKEAQEQENSILSQYGSIMNEYLSGAGKEITITIDSNDGTGKTKQITVIEGAEMQIPTIEFEREGYYSVKYNTKSDGTGEDLKIGEQKIFTQDIIVYAIWYEDNVLKNAQLAKPSNSTLTETNPNEGIVMVDSNSNEWVWVEVPKSIYTSSIYASANSNKGVINSTDYDGIYNILDAYADVYRVGSDSQSYSWTDEWYNGCGIADSATYITKYNNMLSSVYTNGGFWISRYEIGDATSTTSNITRVDNQGSNGIAVSKQNQIPYNYVTCSQAQILADGLKTDNKTSSLLFGIQWDLTCKFLEKKAEWGTTEQTQKVAYINSNCTGWGNYFNRNFTLNRGEYNIKPTSSTSEWTSWTEDIVDYVVGGQKSGKSVLLTTGASDAAKKMNIYDFAGNQWEWTLEKTTDSSKPCARRGGSYSNYSSGNSGAQAARRSSYSANSDDEGIAFRVSLY